MDDAWFERALREQMDYAFGTAYALLGHREDAWDAVQESLARCYRRRHSWRGEGSFAAWLHRIVVNQCRATRRRKFWRRFVPFSSLGRTEERNIFENLPDPERGTGPDAGERERQERLTRALSRLTFRQREVVALRYFSGLPLEEIATRTGRRLGTIKAHLHQARTRLALEMERDHEHGSV